MLQASAGTSPVEDARKSGYIQAVKDLLNIRLENDFKEFE
jgi:hypothetical protein